MTLPSDTQILIERWFDAPKALVWRAWTTPELARRWWGGKRGQVTHTEFDLRVGGFWRFVMTSTEGMEVAFHGECLEVVPEERLVSTEVFEMVPDASSTTTLTLTEEGGRTHLRILVEHETKEHRDMHIESGMEGGMQESMDALEAVARSLA